MLAAASIAATAIGTGISAMGQMAASRQQQAYAQAQAKQAEYQATSERQQAEYTAATQRNRAVYERERAEQMEAAGNLAKLNKEQEGDRLISRQMSVVGASGLDPTSFTPLAVMEETAARVERDALMERYRYQLGASEAGMTASTLESSARLAEHQGRSQAGLFDYQADTYNDYAGSIGRATPWKVGGTLITGMASALSKYGDYKKGSKTNSTWKPFGG
jgi:hypothetical protein